MDREVPYFPDVKCDNCGNMGGLDFMGDSLCHACFAGMSVEDDEQHCYYADPPTFREFIQGLIEWAKLEIRGY